MTLFGRWRIKRALAYLKKRGAYRAICGHDDGKWTVWWKDSTMRDGEVK